MKKKTSTDGSCRLCGKGIDGHNIHCHDGMCDDCFFKTYFPDEVRVADTPIKDYSIILRQEQRENMRLKEFMKFGAFDEERFKKIVKEVSEKIDCTKCANCCKVADIVLDDPDMERIAAATGMTKEDFISRHLRMENGEYLLKDKPCAFIKDDKCKIYDARPRHCRGYPYLDKDATERTIQFFSNAQICPIAYNVLQNAKEEFLEDMYESFNEDL